MTKHYCDRCGQHIFDNVPCTLEIVFICTGGKKLYKLLCEECETDLRTFLKGKPKK